MLSFVALWTLVIMVMLGADAAWAQERVLAILPFDAHTDREDLAPLGGAMADMLTTDLLKADGVRVVERARLDAILDELDLQQTSRIDASTAQRVGRLVGASHLVVGSITALGDRLRLDARVVDVETGESRLAEEREGAVDSFFALERALARRIVDRLELRVSPAETTALAVDEAPRVAIDRPDFWEVIRDVSAGSTPRKPARHPQQARTGLFVGGAGLGVVVVSFAVHRAEPKMGVGGWRTLQVANGLGWVALGTGVGLTAVGLSKPKAKPAAMQLRVGPGRVGVAGRF